MELQLIRLEFYVMFAQNTEKKFVKITKVENLIFPDMISLLVK